MSPVVPKISESTLMSLGVVTMLVGLAFWVGTIWMMVQRHDQDITQLKHDTTEDRRVAAEKMDRVSAQLGGISAQIDMLLKGRKGSQ